MEDHHGQLVIGTPSWLSAHKDWNDLGGASVSLIFPEYQKQDQDTKYIMQDNDNYKTAS